MCERISEDSGLGHDWSHLIHDMQAFGLCDCVTGIACALRWGVALVGDISTKLCSPRRGITFLGTREDNAPSRP